MINLSEQFILSNWEKDFEDHLYFTYTIDGDSIGYDFITEAFSLEDYRFEISKDEAVKLLRGAYK
jgi:hypothetical protein